MRVSGLAFLGTRRDCSGHQLLGTGQLCLHSPVAAVGCKGHLSLVVRSQPFLCEVHLANEQQHDACLHNCVVPRRAVHSSQLQLVQLRLTALSPDLWGADWVGGEGS